LHAPFSMTSRGWADLYAWQIDRASRTPLARQIYMQVRSAVLAGVLSPGSRVPSSRAMASKLGVARASVVSAYEHLLAEGYVKSRSRLFPLTLVRSAVVTSNGLSIGASFSGLLLLVRTGPLCSYCPGKAGSRPWPIMSNLALCSSLSEA
jgi:DNA-binding transcriptional MocR family regulator